LLDHTGTVHPALRIDCPVLQVLTSNVCFFTLGCDEDVFHI